jgi:hypothetical protein
VGSCRMLFLECINGRGDAVFLAGLFYFRRFGWIALLFGGMVENAVAVQRLASLGFGSKWGIYYGLYINIRDRTCNNEIVPHLGTDFSRYFFVRFPAVWHSGQKSLLREIC